MVRERETETQRKKRERRRARPRPIACKRRLKEEATKEIVFNPTLVKSRERASKWSAAIAFAMQLDRIMGKEGCTSRPEVQVAVLR